MKTLVRFCCSAVCGLWVAPIMLVMMPCDLMASRLATWKWARASAAVTAVQGCLESTYTICTWGFVGAVAGEALVTVFL